MGMFGTDTKMTIYVKDSGTWQRIKSVHNNVSGTWERADQGVSANDSGTWRTVYAEGSQEYPSAETTSFTVPEGVHYMTLSASGAGGGAGGAYYSTAGQGGSGGGYIDSVEVECTPGTSISITVGNGGTGGKFGETSGTFGNNSTSGTATTISGFTVTGNVTSSTITLNGGGAGRGGNDAATAGIGGTSSGVTGGTTGQTGQQSGTTGRGGYSLGGTIESGYGTKQAYNPSRACWGVNGDTATYAMDKGTGGCGVPDGSSCGEGAFGGGGDGADGYVLMEWGNE